jgi:hypothetical protein
MKTKYIFIALLSFSVLSCQESGNVKVDTTAEKASVEKVLHQYKTTLENLSIEGIADLFTKNSKVYESGGLEGSIEDYLGHHLGPELGEFESFKFSDYSVEVEVDFPFAFTTESYNFTIILKADTLEDGTVEEPRVIERKGVATSVLKKMNGDWKIMKTHSSSRKPRKSGGH